MKVIKILGIIVIISFIITKGLEFISGKKSNLKLEKPSILNSINNLAEKEKKEEKKDAQNLLKIALNGTGTIDSLKKIDINSKIGKEIKKISIKKINIITKYSSELDVLYNKIDEEGGYKDKKVLQENIKKYDKIIKLTKKFIYDIKKLYEERNNILGGETLVKNLEKLELKKYETQLEIYKNEKELYELYFDNFEGFYLENGVLKVYSFYMNDEHNRITEKIEKNTKKLNLYVKMFDRGVEKSIKKYLK